MGVITPAMTGYATIRFKSQKNRAWEFKWNPNIRLRLSKTFAKAYPDHGFNVITPDNFEDFICMDIQPS